MISFYFQTMHSSFISCVRFLGSLRSNLSAGGSAATKAGRFSAPLCNACSRQSQCEFLHLSDHGAASRASGPALDHDRCRPSSTGLSPKLPSSPTAQGALPSLPDPEESKSTFISEQRVTKCCPQRAQPSSCPCSGRFGCIKRGGQGKKPLPPRSEESLLLLKMLFF